jgi:hypothetical protein
MTVNTADLSHAAWRKSSRSNGQRECVEVAVLGTARWHKSSYSNHEANCVEVADLGGDAVAVRDSKNTSGPALLFTPNAWRTFAARIKAGSDLA